MTLVLLDHLLATGLDLTSDKQATKKLPQAGKWLTNILLKFLVARGLGGSL